MFWCCGSVDVIEPTKLNDLPLTVREVVPEVTPEPVQVSEAEVSEVHVRVDNTEAIDLLMTTLLLSAILISGIYLVQTTLNSNLDTLYENDHTEL